MCGIWQLFYKNISNQDPKVIEYYRKLFDNVLNRGPDMSNFIIKEHQIVGFHRLAINGLTEYGMQPFSYETETHSYSLICNGEIYNHKELEKLLSNFNPKSSSDCEFLLKYFVEICLEDTSLFFNNINGEFALVITKMDKTNGNTDIYLGTDPLSVRPMFYQEINSVKKGLLISSLLKGLTYGSTDEYKYENYRLKQGEVRHYKQCDGEVTFIKSNIYHPIVMNGVYKYTEENNQLYQIIVNRMYKAVEKRLMSDRPLCCLLSGGLDSSLVAAIAQKILNKKGQKLTTFTIGMQGGSDFKYAKAVADHIGSDHHEIYFTPEQGLNAIELVVKTCETFDITTIRASVGQNLIAKYISENTDFKVVLNGDGADEVEMGYLYFYMAPNEKEAQEDSERLVRNISLFDGLRVDRNISSYGLEARVPFLDSEFVDMYMSIDPKLKIPVKERMEKYLIRKAFESTSNEFKSILPDCVLWRKKEAFSDGVSQKEKSWYVMTQEYGKQMVSDEELTELKKQFTHVTPHTNESAYYRMIFDYNFGKQSEKCIPYFWLPNWSTSKDPSARTLQVYHENENKDNEL